jgi:hypothetical protein
MNFVGPWLEMDQRPEAVPAGGFQIPGRDISNSFASNLRFVDIDADLRRTWFVLLQFSMLMAEVEATTQLILEAADEDSSEHRANRACLAVSAH